MGTKIFVVHIKQIIKFGAIVLGGIVLLTTLIILFSSNNNEDKTSYKDGVYTSQIILNSSPVEVNVEVDRNKIVAITMTPLNDTQSVFYPQFNEKIDEIAKSVIDDGSTEILRKENTSVTTDILLNAIDDALSQAEK